jgi:hypothetical protein
MPKIGKEGKNCTQKIEGATGWIKIRRDYPRAV